MHFAGEGISGDDDEKGVMNGTDARATTSNQCQLSKQQQMYLHACVAAVLDGVGHDSVPPAEVVHARVVAGGTGLVALRPRDRATYIV